MNKKAKPTTEKPGRKKPGPVANPNLVATSVTLETQQLEWGKNQPGGLSALLRRLLQEAIDAEADRAGK